MKPVQLNLHHLITFYFVASEKSFSVAAEKLFLTEPAVSRQVSYLEGQIGAKLLMVDRKRVCLTTKGEGLFQYAEEIYKQAKSAEKFLDSSRQNNLHIGVSTTFSSVVARAASEFEILFSDVRLMIRNGPSYEIVEDLLNLQYDIAVVASMDYPSPKLKALRVSDGERLVLVASPSNPICLKKQLKLADLYGNSLLLPREGSATRAILLEKFKAEGLDVTGCIAMEVDYLECSKRLAEVGKAIALVPEAEVEEEVAQGKLKILPLINDITTAVDCLMHGDIILPQIGEEFISLVKEAFQTHCCH